MSNCALRELWRTKRLKGYRSLVVSALGHEPAKLVKAGDSRIMLGRNMCVCVDERGYTAGYRRALKARGNIFPFMRAQSQRHSEIVFYAGFTFLTLQDIGRGQNRFH